MTPTVSVSVQAADFDLGEEVAVLRQGCLGVGAVVNFVGTVRQWLPEESNHAAPGEVRLALEHYPGMTDRMLLEEAQRAAHRFHALGVRLIHRVGELSLGDQIVLVAVVAAHRHAAFDCCAYLMDWLKTQAPFWKKECGPDAQRWVDARELDSTAFARWQSHGAAPAPDQVLITGERA